MKTIQVYLVFNSFKMLGESNFCERKLVVFWNTLLEVGISFAALAPTMTSCSSPSSTRLLWPQSTHLLFQPSAAADKIVFYSVYQPGRRGVAGAGARMGRVVASKCDPYYVWHTHISTIQECMQTANLRQNVNSWYLATNANKLWNQSWKKWNKKSSP